MPYPNFDPKLTVTDGGMTVTLSGPLDKPDPSLESTHLFASVMQVLDVDEPDGDEDAEPTSASARGEVTFYPEAGHWSFTAAAVGGTAFSSGGVSPPAPAPRLAKNGSTEPSTGSRWVWWKLRP